MSYTEYSEIKFTKEFQQRVAGVRFVYLTPVVRIQAENNQYLCHNSSQSNLRYIYMFHWYISLYLSIGLDSLKQRNPISWMNY